ncbi:DUF3310 domain-containing protein [Sporosarcina newyorkensis]|uniref:DUF3310 domain-containing protein n=1 Tax=Sporosarcina newyorkensis TaxID=759851 RepID=UPI003CFCDE17
MKLKDLLKNPPIPNADIINKPDHYHKGGIDVISFCEGKLSAERRAGFFQMNILKYVTRYEKKNGVEDLQKAKFYLDELIKLEESK